MNRTSENTMFSGIVEMDETYIGGKAKGRGAKYNKEAVIGIRERGGELRFFHASDVASGTLAKYIQENISPDVEFFMSDEFRSYQPAMIEAKIHGSKHKTISHKKGMYVSGDVHTNTVESAFSLLKRGVIGTWHKISAKHLEAYLHEMSFRFNRRKNPDLFVDTLRHMITAPTLTFEKLTA
jgi:transposase-like protein